MYPEKTKPARGTLRRIFGKVAAVVALAATVVFYGLGFQIGHAYYAEWQSNKAAETQTYEATQPARQDHTANLPWVAAGASLGLAYGMGFAGIALGKKKDSYTYGSYGSSGSGGNDNFWLGYVMGSNNGGGGSSSSSKNNGGAAAAIVIVGAVALATGASVVSYKAVKGNFFTGEPPIFKSEVKDTLEELASKSSRPSLEETFAAKAEAKPPAPSSPPPAPEPSGTANDPVVVDPTLVKKWKPLAI